MNSKRKEASALTSTAELRSNKFLAFSNMVARRRFRGSRDCAELSVAQAFEAGRAPRPILILLPFYRRPDLAKTVVGSLIDCAEELQKLRAELVLYNDSPEDCLLRGALAEMSDKAGAHLPCRLHINPKNLGFVGTTNQGLAEAAARGMDVLILNSDTVVFPGSLSEMVRVSRLDPMTGFVNPRSNNATLASLPFQDHFRNLAPQPAYDAWNRIQGLLPDVSYVPTAVGFCLFIRWFILAEFGVFDEIYGAGYNEENDLVMRAGRRGYRAVLANRAFVWHQGRASFRLGDAHDAHDQANRSKLTARYPEFWGCVQDHFGSPAALAEQLLGALIPGEDGRLQVALDFSEFQPAHNGTFRAGRQLLEVAVELWSDRFEVSVICSEAAYIFHNLQATGAQRRDPADPGLFAAIFRVGQPFEYESLERLANHAAAFGVYMLDTISLDCTLLAKPRTAHIWAFTAEHADLIASTSGLTTDQLDRRLKFGPDVMRLQCMHSFDLADYRGGSFDKPLIKPGYILVVGNHYWHKDVASTVNALAEALKDRVIVAVVASDEAYALREVPPVDAGRYAPRNLAFAANVVRMPAGAMSDADVAALYGNAQAVVFPSHYEGFGMPVLNALAACRPVFVRPLPVFEEMDRTLGGEPNLHVYQTTRELVARLANPPTWRKAGASQGVAGDAVRAAREIGEALDMAIARVSYRRIVKRITALQFAADWAPRHGAALIELQSTAPPISGAPPCVSAPATPEAFVARAIGRFFERAAANLLRIPGMFETLRLGVHGARAIGVAARPEADQQQTY